MFSEPHSTKQIEDCVGWGLETEPGTLADTSRGFQSCGTKAFGTPVNACAAPSSSSTATRTRSDRIATARLWLTRSRAARHDRRRWSRSPRPRSSAVNRLISDFVQQLHPVPTKSTWVRAARRPKRALYICARRSGSVTPGATWRSRPSSARTIPISRSTGSPSIRSIGPRARRGTCAPGVRLAGQRVGPHRGRVRASTTCTRSRRSAGWTRSSSTTSWSSTTSSRSSSTTWCSVTRRGTSTTSSTRTPS